MPRVFRATLSRAGRGSADRPRPVEYEPPDPGRGGGRHRAVQHAAQTGDPLGGARPRTGQRGDPQARSAHPGLRWRRDRQSLRGGGAACRPTACPARRRRTGFSDGRASRRQRRVFHRFHPGRSLRGRARRTSLHPRPPRTGRQQRDDRAPRRRPGQRDERPGVRQLLQPRPGLHDHRPTSGARVHLRRLRVPTRREGRNTDRGQPNDRGCVAWSDHRRQAARQDPCTGHRQRRGGSQAAHRWHL